MENWGYIRLFKLSRQAFFPKSAFECHSQQRAAMFDYADEDTEDGVLSRGDSWVNGANLQRRAQSFCLFCLKTSNYSLNSSLLY